MTENTLGSAPGRFATWSRPSCASSSPGEPAPGEHPVDDRLAGRPGVSRNPVCEAIRVLAGDGLP